MQLPAPTAGSTIFMQVSVGCTLGYTLDKVTGFVFQIEAAKADGQTILSEKLALPADGGTAFYATYEDPVTKTRVIRTLLGPGHVEINYTATIDLETKSVEPIHVAEFEFAALPMEYLTYLAPSRYCPSDVFAEFAFQTFGTLPRGHSRVTGICNWIYDNLQYTSGSTGPNSTAVDVFQSKKGVCRDFAHLGIAFCRALGIPARYASVYAVALYPQDFHAIFQAYLNGPDGGAWYSFDPTRMSSIDEIVRIAAGRDAADVAFSWPQGEAKSDIPIVLAMSPDHAPTRTTLAVSS
jgi:transglutaminase-like putative cysteine protease